MKLKIFILLLASCTALPSCRSKKIETQSSEKEFVAVDSLHIQKSSRIETGLRRSTRLSGTIEFDSLVICSAEGSMTSFYGVRGSLTGSDSTSLGINREDSVTKDRKRDTRFKGTSFQKSEKVVKSRSAWAPVLSLGLLGIFFVTLWRKHKKH